MALLMNFLTILRKKEGFFSKFIHSKFIQEGHEVTITQEHSKVKNYRTMSHMNIDGNFVNKIVTN